MVDPVLVAIVALLVGFFFFIYLMIRRTMVEFRQGVDRGKDGGG
jgi:hypothetical protein